MQGNVENGSRVANDNAFPSAGVLSQRPDDVARILETLRDKALPIATFLGEDGHCPSRLLFIDPERHYIIIAAPGGQLSAVLLARSQVEFLAELDGLHVEFPGVDPQPTMLAGEAAIRLRFPAAVMRQQQRRTEPRVPVPGHTALHCEADSGGFAPFDGELVDISHGGIGFLVYGAAIQLAPGTVLRGSRIDRMGRPPLVVDLEVRHTRPVTLGDGRQANRSGCLFLNPTREIADLIDSFNAGAGPDNGVES